MAKAKYDRWLRCAGIICLVTRTLRVFSADLLDQVKDASQMGAHLGRGARCIPRAQRIKDSLMIGKGIRRIEPKAEQADAVHMGLVLADNSPLDKGRDLLVNVNALGVPVPSARFMGGREYDLALQGAGGTETSEGMAQVLQQDIMLLPGLVPGSGPSAPRV